MYLEQETDRDAMLEYERALKNITGAYGLGSDVKPENPVGYLALLDQEHYDKSVKRCYDAAVPMAQQIESRKALE